MVMGLSPVWLVEVSQLQPQHRTDPDLQYIDNIKTWHPYRGSGLVRRPEAELAVEDLKIRMSVVRLTR
jgi:hypothetical protein